MKDQYGEQVPDDLVLIPDIKHLSEKEIKIVCNVDWYDLIVYMGDNETCTILCVSAKAINFLDDYLPSGKPIEVLRINDVLKRWDVESSDGFYHAQENEI